jgi:integrase
MSMHSGNGQQGMSDSKPRYFVEKPQKGGSVLHYWQPSKALTAAGYKTVALSRNRAEAIRQAEALNRKVDQWRGGLPVLAVNRHGTLPWLIEQYKQSQDYQKLRNKISRNVHLRKLLKWSADRGDPPMRVIKKLEVQELWNSVQHRPGAARDLISVGRILWNYADSLDLDLVTSNPFRKIKVPNPKPRSDRWTPGQIAAVITTALTPGPWGQRAGEPRWHPNYRAEDYYAPRPSIALAVLIAANTAQRQGDILAMKRSQYNGKTITLTQSKTGTTLEIPVTRELKQALDEYLSDTSTGQRVVALHQHDRHILINETTGRPWDRSDFVIRFRGIARAAGIPDRLQFRDLRRTATVQLAEAGCTEQEIAAFGGWSIRSVHQMLAVYCPLNLTMANHGLVKLENYRAGKLEG